MKNAATHTNTKINVRMVSGDGNPRLDGSSSASRSDGFSAWNPSIIASSTTSSALTYGARPAEWVSSGDDMGRH
jgi:hypothetical protein